MYHNYSRHEVYKFSDCADNHTLLPLKQIRQYGIQVGAAHLGELELMDELPWHRRFQTRTDPFLEDTEGELVDRYRLTKEVALDLL